jgi:hypothetical protein
MKPARMAVEYTAPDITATVTFHHTYKVIRFYTTPIRGKNCVALGDQCAIFLHELDPMYNPAVGLLVRSAKNNNVARLQTRKRRFPHMQNIACSKQSRHALASVVESIRTAFPTFCILVRQFIGFCQGSIDLVHESPFKIALRARSNTAR